MGQVQSGEGSRDQSSQTAQGAAMLERLQQPFQQPQGANHRSEVSGGHASDRAEAAANVTADSNAVNEYELLLLMLMQLKSAHKQKKVRSQHLIGYDVNQVNGDGNHDVLLAYFDIFHCSMKDETFAGESKKLGTVSFLEHEDQEKQFETCRTTYANKLGVNTFFDTKGIEQNGHFAVQAGLKPIPDMSPYTEDEFDDEARAAKDAMLNSGQRP